MKNKAYFLIFYSLITLVGGCIGYFKTGSIASLISAGIVSSLLDICAIGMLRGKAIAQTLSISILFLILAFFGYRYILAFKFMPAGMMLIMTSITLGYLLKDCKSCKKLNT